MPHPLPDVRSMATQDQEWWPFCSLHDHVVDARGQVALTYGLHFVPQPEIPLAIHGPPLTSAATLGRRTDNWGGRGALLNSVSRGPLTPRGDLSLVALGLLSVNPSHDDVEGGG